MFSSIRKALLIVVITGLPLYIFGQNSHYFSLPKQVNETDYIKHKLIIKIKPDFHSKCSNSEINLPDLQHIFLQLGITTIQKKFPTIKSPDKKFNELGQAYADLSLIYEIDYQSDNNIEQIINLILSTSKVEYAQPQYIQKSLDYIPADPLNFNQYHLPLIKAYKAWDLYKGDTNTVIGIVDWGTDIDHPDLVSNLKYNFLDPIDGIDNDNDGYTDNYRGWDLGDNDNNPQGIITHGCFSSGLSSAKTDNNTGLSGTGFLCKYLPVKISDSNNLGIKSYEGIVYAVEHGCSIVNCSWGNTFNSGPFGQDVITYATINRGALVIASCGNNNSVQPFFPASYNYVLSVSASNNIDTKWSGSSYGYYVDIDAPGENVWSTLDGGTYGASSGTSTSAPIVSGCAALLKSKFPSMSGLQIGEKLKVSADIIDTIYANLPYKYLLGSGRINLYNALTDSMHPSVSLANHNITDLNHDGIFTKNDTLIITGNFINYLSPSTASLKVTLKCLSGNTSMIDSVAMLGIINTLSTTNNNSQPFRVMLKPGILANEDLIFKLTYSDINYSAFQYFNLIANINYLNIDTNLITTTICSEGMIGYNNGNSSQGLGFTYNNSETLISSGGFIVGKSYTQVSDVLPGPTGIFDHDFFSIKNVSKISPSSFSDIETLGIFNDSLAQNTKLNVELKHQSFAWSSAPNDKFIIIRYTIKNRNNILINNLYAGIYMDWDIGNFTKNRIGFDPSNRLGYCFSIEGGTFTGISLLTGGNLIHYGFDNNGSNGSINISDGFATNEKYSALKSSRNDAGMFSGGNDVSQMVSSGPYALGPTDSVVIAFALIAGDHLNSIQNSAAQAKQMYYQTGISENLNSSARDFELFQNEPNPFQYKTQIRFYLNKNINIELALSDIKGLSKEIIYKGELNKGYHTFSLDKKLSPGIYFYTLTSGLFSESKKMSIVK